MTKLQTAIVSAVAVVSFASFWRIQHEAGAKRREENRSLRQQNEQLAQLAPENERLAKLLAGAKNSQTLGNGQMNELLKLRGEVGGLRRLTNELGKVQADNQRLKASLASGGRSTAGTKAATEPDSLPKESWAFAGYADPESAFQTAIWAMSQGDAKTFLASLSPDGAEFKELVAKSENEIATRGKAEFEKVTAFKIIDKEAISNDEVILTAFAYGINESARFRIQRAGNEWKVAGPAKNKSPGEQ